MDKDQYIVFVSDVHITDESDDKYSKLLNLIKSPVALEAKSFVLLGDIFDFYFGAKAYFQEKFIALYKALNELSESGVEVIFMEGNHEFGMLDDTNFEKFLSKSDYLKINLDHRKLLLSHGDLIFADNAYLKFRSVIKSAWAQFIAKVFFTGKFLDRYALWHAGKSRSKSSYRKIDHDGILDHANKIAMKQNVDTFVFGHFHVPYEKQMVDSGIHLLSMNSWVDKPNYLKLYSDRVERVSVK